MDIYLLFFIQIGTRRVHVTGLTANPDAVWIKQQARNFALVAGEGPKRATHLIMDMDSKFTAEFRSMLKNDGVEVVRVGPRLPNLSAYAERFVQTVQTECLDHFIVFGEDHLRHLVDEFVQGHYNVERPHQSLDNRTLPEAADDRPATLAFPGGKVECTEKLGGLIKQYRRAA